MLKTVNFDVKMYRLVCFREVFTTKLDLLHNFQLHSEFISLYSKYNVFTLMTITVIKYSYTLLSNDPLSSQKGYMLYHYNAFNHNSQDKCQHKTVKPVLDQRQHACYVRGGS